MNQCKVPKNFEFHIDVTLILEHSVPVDVELSNKKYLARTEEFWDTLDSSGWWQLESEEYNDNKNNDSFSIKKKLVNGDKK